MMRVNSRLARSLWHSGGYFVQFYWQNANQKQRRTAVLGLLGLTVLSFLVGAALVYESIQRGEFISALAAREPQRFQAALVEFVGILLASAALLSVSAYVRDWLGLQWRTALTRQLIETYLSDRRYYHLSEYHSNHDVDNPDQRISEDAKNVAQIAVVTIALVVESGVQLVGFISVLLSISLGLTGFLLAYALAGSAIVTSVFGLRLTRLNAEQLKREADFRFNLINVRENAESIAFYQIQAREQHQRHRKHNLERQSAGDRFGQVVTNVNRLIRWQLGLDCFQNGYQYLTFVLPSLILAPRILAGDLEVGAIVQSQAAFDRIWLSLSLVIIQFEQLTRLTASAGRLKTLIRALQLPEQENIEGNNIEVLNRPYLSVESLSLRTRKRALVQQLTFALAPQTPLLIMGPSGVGKSCLIKAIAGLWQLGQGRISCPQNNTAADAVLFLPQQPYIVLGTLRQQLLYPHGADRRSSTDTDIKPSLELVSDVTLKKILNQVQLTELTDLDRIEDWSQQLSTGEQQRLAFARLLILKPAYAILDEATSALSLEQEKYLYQQLLSTKTTFISIGHRASLLDYHHQVLTLADDGTWALEQVERTP